MFQNSLLLNVKCKMLGVGCYVSIVQKGFSLVEVLLAVSLFGMIVTVLVGGLIFGQEGMALSGMRGRAVLLADEGLEATRNIRDAGFSNLTDGTHGLAISGNNWIFLGSSDSTDSFYSRSITIHSVDTNRKQVVSTVSWQQTPTRSGSVTLTTYLTAWINPAGGAPPTNCTDYCKTLSEDYSVGTCRANTVQCGVNGEIYEAGGDPICVAGFPGDPSHDTCCCK